MTTVGEGDIETISIHFDVPGHAIPLSTFVRTSQEAEAVLRSLTTELLGDVVEFEFLVLPPEEGSFLTRIGVILLAGWGVVWTFTESDIGKAFLKGLTDHEPAYWAEKLGKTLKSGIKEGEEEKPARTQPVKGIAASILAEATTGFLQKPTSELEAVGVTVDKFRDAYRAKSEFYEACIATPQLRAIGFSESPIFPIRRAEFIDHQAILLPAEPDEEQPWFVATVLLRVPSPNWDREDRARHWKGQDQHGRHRYFRIEDEEFWVRVAAGKISTHIVDTMKVQWAFQGKPEQPRNCRVLRVLEFNQMKLAEPLTDDALIALLGTLGDLSTNQQDLFEK